MLRPPLRSTLFPYTTLFRSFSVMNSAMRTQNQALVDLENLTAVNRNRQTRLEAVETRIDELRIEAEEALAAADAAQQERSEERRVGKREGGGRLRSVTNDNREVSLRM